jgi:amino acid permease
LLTSAGLGSGGASQAFGWLQNLSTLAGLVAWAVMCFTYIRFHAALKAQGVDRSTLPWKSAFQPFTAWWGFIGAVIIALITGFPVFLKGNWNTSDFIASYIGIPIFFVPLFVWKFVKKTKVRFDSSLSQSYRLTTISGPVHPKSIYTQVDFSMVRSLILHSQRAVSVALLRK